jgi:glutamate dehydrogenase
VFDFVGAWHAIESLDNKVADAVQSTMLIDLGRLLYRGTIWFLRSRVLGDDMGGTIGHFAPRIATLASRIPDLLDSDERTRRDERAARYMSDAVPSDIAARVVNLDALYATLDIVAIADARSRPLETVADVYFAISAKLDLPWLRERIAALAGDAHWQVLARGAMLDDLYALQRTITAEVLGTAAEIAAPGALIAAWQARNERGIARAAQLLTELRAAPAVDAAMISVALRELRNLA